MKKAAGKFGGAHVALRSVTFILKVMRSLHYLPGTSQGVLYQEETSEVGIWHFLLQIWRLEPRKGEWLPHGHSGSYWLIVYVFI